MANSRTTKHTTKQIAKQETEIPVTMVTMDDVKDKIIILRDIPVLLDRDVATLYGVETKDVNRAVRNNPEKFPQGYIFRIDEQENRDLRLKIFTANNTTEQEQLSLSKVRYLPVAFTEKGLYMLATILKSKQAVATTSAIIETFAEVRELVRTMNEMQQTENEVEQKSLMKRTGEIISDVIGSQLDTTGTETEFEINLAVFKMKHTIKRKKKK